MQFTKPVIPEALNPTYLDYLKAKSAERGGNTLAEHTWAVLLRLADQYHLRSQLMTGSPRLWHRMYWGCFLHDFGKAAREFQERLQPDPAPNLWSEGRHRHEVLSLAFVDWLFPRGHIDRLAVIGIIGAHHKDFHNRSDIHTIKAKYGGIKPDADQRRRVEFLTAQLTPDVVRDLYHWLSAYGSRWAEHLGLLVEPVELQSPRFEANAIFAALEDWDRSWFDPRSKPVPVVDRHLAMIERGLILTSDHAASAGTDAFPVLDFDGGIILSLPKGKTWNTQQLRAQTTDSTSTLLIAPTGSGKTEAALWWAWRQYQLRPYARLFYALPYQASMNAMQTRLQETVFKSHPDYVAIQHSRATLKLYQEAMNADSGAADEPEDRKRQSRRASAKAAAQQNLTRLNYFPVQVFSPYQMLKAAYQLKGYEALLLDYTDGVFIFDEIHAYDPERLALMVGFMEWLRQYRGARFLVMTATLPPTVKDVLTRALDLRETDEITADSITFAESQRHIVRLQDGELLNAVDAIVDHALQGKRILVTCNQVKRAQAFYDALSNFTGEKMLLHGRFSGHDRTEKEGQLTAWAGVGQPHTGQPLIVVATQVVEVSLNVDFDSLYSDPAPLEALLQRFGRVNRGRGSRGPGEPELCDVHVFRLPEDEAGLKPYDRTMIQRSLEVLENTCLDRPIDEAQVTTMLARIYDETVSKEWLKKYQAQKQLVDRMLAAMVPYQSADPTLEKQFYDNFDGYQVVPAEHFDAYLQAKENFGLFAAMGYLVNITRGQYHMLKHRGLIQDEDFPAVASVPYDSEYGLRLDLVTQPQRQQAFADDDV